MTRCSAENLGAVSPIASPNLDDDINGGFVFMQHAHPYSVYMAKSEARISLSKMQHGKYLQQLL